MPRWSPEQLAAYGARRALAPRDASAVVPPIAVLPGAFEIDLPWPPGVNNMYRPVLGTGRRILTDEAEAYRQNVIGILALARAPQLRGELGVTIVKYEHGRHRLDIDGGIKAVLDALEHGGLYANDRQVKRLTVTVKASAANAAYVHVHAWELPT